MRVEAVQNERRPYTCSTDSKHDLLNNSINGQRIRKQHDNAPLNTVNKKRIHINRNLENFLVIFS